MDSIQPTAFSTLVLYAIFGPILACVLCVGQLTRAGQTHDLDKTARWANVTVLLLAPLALGLVLLTGFVLWGLRGGT